MKVNSRIRSNGLNSRNTIQLQDMGELFGKVKNLPSKTIRMFPQNAISLFTEGMGEIYSISDKKNDVKQLEERKYQWKLKGPAITQVRFTRDPSVTTDIGLNGQLFSVFTERAGYNPNEVFRTLDGTQCFVHSLIGLHSDGVSWEYLVQLHGGSPSSTIDLAQLTQGATSGYLYNVQPELHDDGYIHLATADEVHVNYLTRVRHDWTVSGDAAHQKYEVEDVQMINGKKVTGKMSASKLLLNGLENFHYSKEFALIYGKATVDSDGKVRQQDRKGRSLEAGSGLIESLHPSCRQTYNELGIELVEDILTDSAKRRDKKTGNMTLLTTGIDGYASWNRMMRKEHKGWDTSGAAYVKTKNGKIRLGAEYSSYTFGGNTLIVSQNEVFDHPAVPSEKDSLGRSLESSKMMFLDVSEYDGCKNIQMLSQDGMGFVHNTISGVGGKDGSTSGEVSSKVHGSGESIFGDFGLVVHNPYSSYIMEKKVAKF